MGLDRRIRLNRTLGPLVVDWIERELVNGPGDVQGTPIELDDDEARFIFRCYEIDDRGRRVVRRAVYSRPKGRAKSSRAAELVCAEALGPVRFAGWDHDGTPLGRPVTAPYIPIAATEEGQAGNVYDVVAFMLREGRIARMRGLDVGDTRTYLPDGGKVQPITARASSKDGGRETFAVFDETHLYNRPEPIKLHATIRRNLQKRKKAEPWSLEASTMYAPGEDSVAELSHKLAQAIASGAHVDAGFLFDHQHGPGPDEFDFDDDDQLRGALLQAYGLAAEWIDLDRIIADARDPDVERADVFRYFLNVPMAGEERWLQAATWEAACVELAEGETVGELPPKGTAIAVGFDGSENNDSTGLVGCTIPRPDEKPYAFKIALWERPEGRAGDDWRVPVDEVEATVAWIFETYRVRRFTGDPKGWRKELRGWAERWSDKVVVELWGNQWKLVSAYCGQAKKAVRYGELEHDGDPDLARHVANAHRKKIAGTELQLIVKDREGSPRKIDLAIGFVYAVGGALSVKPPSDPWAITR